MSLFGSLTTAVSGLDAQQDALGNISNNIANSQTIGYKDVGTAFTELVTQSNQSYNAPGGVIATPVYMNSLAGSAVGTSTNTNLAISGSGFFVVKAPPAISPNGTTTFNGQNLYTQAG
ncbi:MAG TPA: flagellar hook-basal body complex protein, partial [Stellaceae bacterium]|nr:flagellar hook-basal body complex protein [Stellaceae bacterium]